MESSTKTHPKIRSTFNQLSPNIQWPSLDEPVKLLIISFAAEHLLDFNGKSIDEAIYDIKTATLFHRKTFHSIINNLSDFTCVVHKLMVVYVDLSTEDIANKFNTPVSLQYVSLSRDLLLRAGNRGGLHMRNVIEDMFRQTRPDGVPTKMNDCNYIRSNDQLQDIKDMINEGADVNYTMCTPATNYKITPLFFAVEMRNLELAKLLMENPKFNTQTIIMLTKTLETIKENRRQAGLK